MDYSSLMNDKYIKKENLKKGFWYETEYGTHICFTRFDQRRIYISSYIKYNSLHRSSGNVTSNIVGFTSADLLKKYGVKQPETQFINKTVDKIETDLNFNNLLKLDIC